MHGPEGNSNGTQQARGIELSLRCTGPRVTLQLPRRTQTPRDFRRFERQRKRIRGQNRRGFGPIEDYAQHRESSVPKRVTTQRAKRGLLSPSNYVVIAILLPQGATALYRGGCVCTGSKSRWDWGPTDVYGRHRSAACPGSTRRRAAAGGRKRNLGAIMADARGNFVLPSGLPPTSPCAGHGGGEVTTQRHR